MRHCSVVVLLASIAIATNATAQTTLEFDRVGVQQHRDYLGLLPFEQLDTQSGNILLTFSDLVLPGNAGHDLRFQFTFNGNAYEPGMNPWSFGLAGLPMRIRQEQSWPAIGSAVTNTLEGTRLITPILQMADGGERRTVFTETPSSYDRSTMNVVRTSNFWEYNRTAHSLKLTDGTTCTYEQIPGADEGTLRLTTVEDVFGNLVTLDWSVAGHLNVTQTLKNESERVVHFDMLGGSGMPTLMTFNDGIHDRTWTYEYDQDDAGRLKAMIPPPGSANTPRWTFTYSATGGRLGEVTTPEGGRITYMYQAENLLAPWGTVSRVLLKSRDLTDRGAGNPMGHWQIECNWAVGSTYCAWTTVVTPTTSTTYYYNPIVVPHPTTLIEGDIGFDRLEVRDYTGTVVEDERHIYVELPVVESTYRSAEILSRTVHRSPSGVAYITRYAYNTSDTSKAGYHCPVRIDQEGDLLRIIERSYKPEYTTPLITCLLQMERVTVGPESRRRDFTYDDDDKTGFVTAETEFGISDNLQMSFTRDEGGNVRTATRRGMTTSFTYSRGQMASIVTPLTTITRVINLDGTMASETRGGRTTQYEYDDLERPITTTPTDGRSPTSILYDGHTASLEQIAVTRGTSSLTTTLDGFGRPILTVDAEGIQRQTRYDAEGRIVYDGYPFTGGGNHGAQIEYDALGRIVRRINPSVDPNNPTVRTWTYTLSGVTFTDENGHHTEQTWQAFGDPDDAWLATIVDADGKLWSYTYYVLGQLASITANDGITRTWTYNNQNLLASETHPESGTTTYSYVDGRLTQKTDANGVDTTYEYDADNRVKQITAGTRTTTIGYETGSNNRTSVTTASVGTTFLYDDGGRLRLRQDAIDGKLFDSRYEYDADDNLRAIVYPSGRRIQYDYNNQHQITKVFETSAGRDYALGMTYHPSGAVATWTASNNITPTLTYDPQRYWPASITSGPLHLTYETYDGAGNVGTITNSHFGNQSFSYDALDRLSTATGSYGSIAYAYDPHGNRQTNSNGSYQYESGTLRLIQQDSIPFTYYNNGNLHTAGPATYTYTPNNMLETATVVGGTVTYTYDGDDSRVKRSAGGSSSYFLRGLNGEVLTEWRDPGTTNGLTRDYVYAGSRLLSRIDKVTTFDPNNNCGVIVPGGASVTVTAIADQNPCVKFVGTAGQRVSVLITNNSINLATFSILRPNQMELFSTAMFGGSGFLDVQTLADPGTYTLVIDPWWSNTGTATLTMYNVPPDTTAAITPDGPPVPVTTTVPGQNARLTFTGASGQRVSVAVTDNSISLSSVGILKPDHTNLSPPVSMYGGNGFLDVQTLTDPGPYTLVIDPWNSNTGTATLRMYDVPPDPIATVTIGGPAAPLTMSTPGQNGTVTFAGTSGQQATVHLSGNSIGLVGVTLRNPNSGWMTTWWSWEGSFDLATQTLPADGNYTITVDPNATNTGSISVSVTSP